MDANGTRFHLLLGKDDWQRCTNENATLCVSCLSSGSEATGLAWDHQRSELILFPRLFQFVATPNDKAPELGDRRGAARDRFGNWYWIAGQGIDLLVNSSGTGVTSHFWRTGDGVLCEEPNGDFQPVSRLAVTDLKLSGLAITEDHYLVVGVLNPKGFLLFDLYGGGPPQQFLWPRSVPFAPFDMAPSPGGGVWILDREHKRYWGLDRQFNVARTILSPPQAPEALDDFQPAKSETSRPAKECLFPRNISLQDAWLVAADNPVAIESLPDGSVLILDRLNEKFSRVFRYRSGEPLGNPVSLAEMKKHIDEKQRDEFRLMGHDFAFVPRAAQETTASLGQLFIAAEEGNQSYAFDLTVEENGFRLQPLATYLPMRLFAGKGLVAADGKVYYDFGDGWIPLIEQPRPRHAEMATLVTPLRNSPPNLDGPENTTAFDGREPNCVWHRLMLDACIPPETDVKVWSRAANLEADLALAGWMEEPDFYLRGDGSEQPFVTRGGENGRGTWELLFQKVRGRFLQLKLTLSGNGQATPRLRALRAYYPRFSYLERYLPAVYRENAESASFLDRFLANLEGFYTALEDKIAAAQILFDARSAPPETLAWLAGWFGIALDPAWNERKQRLFIQHAMDFFQSRGTIRGLQMALRLALEPEPGPNFFSGDAADRRCAESFRVVERFRLRRTPGVVLGDPTASVGLREISGLEHWHPEDGADELHRRYREFLAANQLPVTATTPFPLAEPPDEKDAVPWREFARATLGFIPSAASDDLERWRDFLQDRYGDIDSLNIDHGTSWAGFEDVPLPADVPDEGGLREDWNDFILEATQLNATRRQTLWQEFLARRYQRIGDLNNAYASNWKAFTEVRLSRQMPANSAALQDWFQFEAVVLAMHQSAHKFVVLLPVSPRDFAQAGDRQDSVALARRLIELEKPAHTVFDLKFYWAMFRVGEARLGEDTLVGLGSRAPELFKPLILNESYLSESYLAPTPPRDAPERFVLGQNLGSRG